MGKRRSQVQFVEEDEELSLRLLLNSQNENDIRFGLRRVCELYQKGTRLRAPQDVRVLIRHFVFDPQRRVDVIRWALKALVEFRDPSDFDLVHSRLINAPADYESFS